MNHRLIGLSLYVLMSLCLSACSFLKSRVSFAAVRTTRSLPHNSATRDLTQDCTLRPKVVFVLGGPGSGKGTQCEKLASEFGIMHLSAGELLRQEITKGTDNGKIIDDYLKRGQIVPVKMSLSLLKATMQSQPCPRILIDGFPRNKDNLLGWEADMKDVCDVDLVLFIDCNEKELERRILDRGNNSGRSDDNLETARKRFQTFQRETMPIIEHFASKSYPQFVRIDGAQSVDAVYARVREVIVEKVKEDTAAGGGPSS